MTRSKTKSKKTVEETTTTITLLKAATASKLNPQSDGGLDYEIGLVEDQLAIRICKNSSGGFFSDEWLLLEDIKTCLGALLTSKNDFKSAALKSIFIKGSSANNAGFLCACLRAEGLLVASDKNVFLHKVTGKFDTWVKSLEALRPK